MPEFALPLISYYSDPIVEVALLRGYTDVNAPGKVTISRPVRSVAGDVAGSWPGLDIHISDLEPLDYLRDVFAMHSGCLTFGYEDRLGGGSDEPSDPSRIRAYLQFLPFSLNNPPAQLGQIAADFTQINSNFLFLKVAIYANLDKEKTKLAIMFLIQQAEANPGSPRSAWILQSPILAGGTLGTWLSGAANTAESYVETLFMSHQQLKTMSGPNPGAGAPLFINAGDAIGKIAHVSASDPATSGNCKLFLSMWDAAGNGLNPLYFFSAIGQKRNTTDFIGDRDDTNKLGVDRLLATNPTPSDADPPPTDDGKRLIHPLLWALRSDRYGLFRAPAGGGHYEFAPFPHFFIPSPIAENRHPNFHSINVTIPTATNPGGLGNFHTHVPRAGTAEHVPGSRYDWEVNERGYLVLRTRGAPGPDDWYWDFSADDFEKARTLWSDLGEDISRFCQVYQIPCELLVATILKESAGAWNAVGLEPWIPPPAPVPPLPRDHFRTHPPPLPAAVSGIDYMMLTSAAWDGMEWPASRVAAGINLANMAAVIKPAEHPAYTWNQLMNDLAALVGLAGPAGGRLANRLDVRISPGLAQVLVGHLHGYFHAPEIAAILMVTGNPNFFIEAGNDVTTAAAPPSAKFRWLLDRQHAVCTAAAVYRQKNLHNLIQQRSQYDPIYLLAAYANLNPLTAGSANVNEDFGFELVHGNEQLFRRALPYFNACVRLFERHELFQGPGALPLPSVRYIRP